MCTGKSDALAKSDGTTLQEHIENLLIIYRQLKLAIPEIEKIAGKDFWQLLFVAIFFHDIGKVHKEFQKKLKGEENCWQNQRHELYSIPFIDKLTLAKESRNLIKLVVLSHHKSFKELVEKYFISKNEMEFEYFLKWKKEGLKFHPKDFEKNIRYKFNKGNLIELFKLFNNLCKRFDIAGIYLKKINFNNLKNPIEEYAKCYCNGEKFKEDWLSLKSLLLWGALKVCDHLGSAKVKKIYLLKENNFYFLNKIEQFYSHQKKCFSKKNCLLIAPTGSGKTEAALGWLRTRVNESQGRAFYVLPYTASINAMHKRLAKDMDHKEISNIVGVQHGNILHYISDFFESMEFKRENIEKNKKIKMLVEQYRSLTVPVTICTPFQILKYLYAVRGFEKGLVFLSGAKIIFDEIHAYDIITFAQLIVLIGFLKKYFFCNFIVMTATLPSFMRNIIVNVLNISKKDIVYADKNFLVDLKRHQIKLFDGDIFSKIDEIVSIVKNSNKKIIVVCNTVKNAQKVYKDIKNKGIDIDDIVLIHGRFNKKDRSQKERLLNEQNVKLLIGTQTIEVSLDIDFDIMFTEPAPLDALLQRFGRINRKGKKETCPIFIARKGGEGDAYIYPQDVVKKTLKELEQVDKIDEGKITEILDKVYPGWGDEERKLFEDTKNIFASSLKSLQPFTENIEREEDFYTRFTNVAVLPVEFLDEYTRLVENFDFISAESLLIDISQKFFFKYLREGKIEKVAVYYWKDNQKYKKKNVYIIKLKYDSRIGLTDQYYESKTFNFI